MEAACAWFTARDLPLDAPLPFYQHRLAACAQEMAVSWDASASASDGTTCADAGVAAQFSALDFATLQAYVRFLSEGGTKASPGQRGTGVLVAVAAVDDILARVGSG